MSDGATLDQIRAVNASAAFNTWAGFEVTQVTGGEVWLDLPWRAEFGQYAGFLHAGMVGALIDTACGFAAATLAGAVLASQYQVLFYTPAVGDHFRAIGRVTKAGRRQIFAAADLFAITATGEKLVAGGTAILITAGT